MLKRIKGCLQIAFKLTYLHIVHTLLLNMPPRIELHFTYTALVPGKLYSDLKHCFHLLRRQYNYPSIVLMLLLSG